MYSILIIGYIMLSLALSMRFSIGKGSKIIYYLFIIGFSLFMAFRSISIPDTNNYILIYKQININHNYGFSLVNEYGTFGIEYGFLWLLWIFKKFISLDYHVMFLSLAFFCTLISVWAISEIIIFFEDIHNDTKIKVKRSLVASIYMSYFGLYYSGVAIRSGIALSLILLVINAALHKKYFFAIVMTLLAFSVQRLSIIGVIVFFVLKYMPKIKKELFVFLWGIIGCLQFIFSVSGLQKIVKTLLYGIAEKYTFLDYSRYLGNVENDSSIYVLAIWCVGFVLIILTYHKKELYRYFNVYLIGMAAIMCLSWVKGYSRLTDFFILMNIPILYKTYSLSSGRLRIISNIVLLISVGLNLYKVLTIYNWP